MSRSPSHLLLLALTSVLLLACNPEPKTNAPAADTEVPANKIQTTSTPIVQTLNGDIQGLAVDGINNFRGIPYAQPPVGTLRWRPPQAPSSWEGLFSADTFSLSCSQPTFTSEYVWRRNDFQTSEDCLYLNVWAQAGAQDLPVMVWFHGGAHTSGQGHSKIFDGTTLAEHGVVLVSINYRLGALGFLAHPWLSEESDHESSGNYGLLDKIAALNWVRDNIAQFGGNPDNVTIFGQSAGSQSVCSLMTSPLAQGLFHKAIGQSAACVGPAPRRDPAGLERGERLVAELGAESLDALRAKSPSDILSATDVTGWANQSRIVIDGWVLPEAQIETFKAGRQAAVPLMVGNLADEGENLIPINSALTTEAYDAYVDATFGSEASRIKQAYVAELEQSPGIAQHAIATDQFMAFAMRRWAEYQTARHPSTYLYFMDHVPPAFHLYMPDEPDLAHPRGPRHAAYHSGDLAFVFGTVDKVGLDWNEEDRALSALMVKYWTNFARTGNPNSDDTPEWPAFMRDSLSTQVLNAQPHTVSGIRRDRIDPMAAALPL